MYRMSTMEIVLIILVVLHLPDLGRIGQPINFLKRLLRQSCDLAAPDFSRVFRNECYLIFVSRTKWLTTKLSHR